MKQLLSFLFVLFFVQANAQDTIVKKDQTKIPANVTKVKTNEVVYRLPGYTDGPVFTLRKSDIASVIYRNGTTEQVSVSQNEVKGAIDHKQSISLNSTDLTFGLVTLTWEMNMFRDKFSIRVPLSTGISAFSKADGATGNYDNYYYSRFKMFSAGIDLLYYPTGQAHVLNYFCGLSTEEGYTKMGPGWYIDFAPYQVESVKVWYGAAGVTNGVLINVNERMSVSPYVTLGMRYGGREYYPYNNRISMCRAGLNMGFRFGGPSLRPNVIKDF